MAESRAPLPLSTLQDIVTRYASASGRHVTRRFGWDCHGLPVEYEIDKKLSELVVCHRIHTSSLGPAQCVCAGASS